jgi:hypothetical protein
LFCFGHERRLALTTALEGLVGLTAMLVLVPWLGIHGAALGSIIGTVAVSLPGNLRALAREEGVAVGAAISPLRPWFGRFVLALAAVLLALAWSPAERLPGAVFAGSVVAILYAALMLPVVLEPPLGSMLTPRLQPWLTRFPGLSRRIASQSVP